jgi:LysM repeat protein
LTRQAVLEMMKKCTTSGQDSLSLTATRILTAPSKAIAIGFSLCLTLAAPALSQTTEAPTSSSKTGNSVILAKDAPDKHVVVRGDTLWAISAKFLATPWKWPEVWQMNRDQIRNPHLIYPGDVVYLDKSGASPRLRLGKAVGANGDAQSIGPNKLEPLVRSEPIDRTPIPTISSQAIEAFLNRPLVVEENALNTAPRIIGGSEARLYLSTGDKIYTRGFSKPPEIGSDWHIYRAAKPILDPDTRKPIAYEAIYVGSARFEKEGDPSTMRITGMQEEIGADDRLVPAERAKTFNYSPKPPETTVSGKIVSIYKGVAQAGKNSVIAVSTGKADGVDVGTVLVIKQLGREVTDRQTSQKLRLPDEAIGHVLIFRTFDKISYGLIMESSGYPVIGDKVTNP